jgi:hypothetical protein
MFHPDHQRMLNGPGANQHMPVVWPEVATFPRRTVRVAHIALEAIAVFGAVAAIIWLIT